MKCKDAKLVPDEIKLSGEKLKEASGKRYKAVVDLVGEEILGMQSKQSFSSPFCKNNSKGKFICLWSIFPTEHTFKKLLKFTCCLFQYVFLDTNSTFLCRLFRVAF